MATRKKSTSDLSSKSLLEQINQINSSLVVLTTEINFAEIPTPDKYNFHQVLQKFVAELENIHGKVLAQESSKSGE